MKTETVEIKTGAKLKRRKPVHCRVLLACPFCGLPPIVEKVGENNAAEMISCMTQGCINPHVSYYGKGVSRKKWNTRAG